MSITGGLVRSVKDIGDELGNLVILGVGVALLYGGFYAYEWIKSGGLQNQVTSGLQSLLSGSGTSNQNTPPPPQIVYVQAPQNATNSTAGAPQVSAITPQTTSTITAPSTPSTVKVNQV